VTSHSDLARAALVDALAEAREPFARALQPGQPNTFRWRGEEFWVDRARWMAFSAPDVARWKQESTLPDDGELGDACNLLEVFGGEARGESTGQILTMFARLLCGNQQAHAWLGTSTHVLNLAVAQPFVNPAFASLFWLALAEDSGPRGHRATLYELVVPMIYEMKVYPDLRPRPGEIRRAQVAFVHGLSPDLDAGKALALSGADWAEQCAEQLRRHHGVVEQNVVHEVLMRVAQAAQEPGARPFP
jgi:hypothetical protein